MGFLKNLRKNEGEEVAKKTDSKLYAEYSKWVKPIESMCNKKHLVKTGYYMLSRSAKPNPNFLKETDNKNKEMEINQYILDDGLVIFEEKYFEKNKKPCFYVFDKDLTENNYDYYDYVHDWAYAQKGGKNCPGYIVYNSEKMSVIENYTPQNSFADAVYHDRGYVYPVLDCNKDEAKFYPEQYKPIDVSENNIEEIQKLFDELPRCKELGKLYKKFTKAIELQNEKLGSLKNEINAKDIVKADKSVVLKEDDIYKIKSNLEVENKKENIDR